MNGHETFILEMAKLLLPVLLAGGIGVHLPQPGYMKPSEPKWPK
jgi:hypothetical protein